MEDYGFLIVLLVIFIIMVIAAIRSRIASKKELLEYLSDSFGKPNTTKLSHNHLMDLKRIVELDESANITESVWNDLNMDEVYTFINQSVSSVGEEYLYLSLHSLKKDKKTLTNRSILAEELKSEASDYRVKLSEIKKNEHYTVYQCIRTLFDAPKINGFIHILMLLAFLASFIAMFIKPEIGVMACLIIAGINCVTYFITKTKIAAYDTVISNIVRWINVVSDLECSSDKLVASALIEKIHKKGEKFKGIRRASWLFMPQSAVGSLIGTVLDYLKFITHLDLIEFSILIRSLQDKQKDLIELYRLSGEFELGLIIASIRAFDMTLCIPTLDNSGIRHIDATSMIHPLVKDAVANDVTIHNHSLITGSNASGKSTFLKMVAVNVLLSETIATAFAKDYKASYFDLASSLNITDNIVAGDSFYLAEIKRLKGIIETLQANDNTLICIDEILKGTNTSERIAASAEILRYLAKGKGIVMAATHDIELTEMLKSDYGNYFFTENPDDVENLFDYKLHKGSNYQGNAIKLLKIYGFPEEIIKGSYRNLEEYNAR